MIYPCSTCGAKNAFVNECGCDKQNMPTRATIENVTLYWGDNGDHEFWQDQSHKNLIIRHPQKKGSNRFWIALRVNGIESPPDTARQAKAAAGVQTCLTHEHIRVLIQIVARQYQVLFSLDETLTWQKVSAGNMKLR
jgi:hypothetical protein